MGLRKALAYSKKRTRAYTRNSKKKYKAFIKTIPYSKIVKFDGGSLKDYRGGKHDYCVTLIAEEKALIRDNALEASRMHLIKEMDTKAIGQYFLSVRVHPHHFLRENKTAAAVAGADRISTGMTQSFGTIIGRAAMVKPGTTLFLITCKGLNIAQIAKNALVKIKAKVPCKVRIIFEQINSAELSK